MVVVLLIFTTRRELTTAKSGASKCCSLRNEAIANTNSLPLYTTLIIPPQHNTTEYQYNTNSLPIPILLLQLPLSLHNSDNTTTLPILQLPPLHNFHEILVQVFFGILSGLTLSLKVGTPKKYQHCCKTLLHNFYTGRQT